MLRFPGLVTLCGTRNTCSGIVCNNKASIKMEIKFNIILTMHINICQYRTKLPHAPKVKIMNLLTITWVYCITHVTS